MTMQTPDTCLYDGRRWEVEDLGAMFDIVPSSASLGFETVSSSTANYSGRIDHFVVHQHSLYLHKIEVCLKEEYLDYVPSRAGKEVIIRYEPMTVTDSQGTREDWWKHEFLLFVFGGGDLKLNGTGEISLLYPCVDLWEVPATDADDESDEYQIRATLFFEDGLLVDEIIENL